MARRLSAVRPARRLIRPINNQANRGTVLAAVACCWLTKDFTSPSWGHLGAGLFVLETLPGRQRRPRRIGPALRYVLWVDLLLRLRGFVVRQRECVQAVRQRPRAHRHVRVCALLDLRSSSCLPLQRPRRLACATSTTSGQALRSD